MKDPTQTNSTVQNENSVIIYPTLMLMESFVVYKTFLELRRKTVQQPSSNWTAWDMF